MATLWLFIFVGAVIALFWTSRQAAEAAKDHAQHQADKLQVQLLSVACQKRRLGILKSGKPGIKSQFIFEFSSDGETVYQGVLHLENSRLMKADIPPHRMAS
ncbi:MULTISPECIES: DUF3301 domain-containing protein [Pseudoalteromonas]|uniref:DUF3301 domain-containing protein n=1 Tax=Pseudoalteromonas amylolytica TaxID=1859457 RepID=A0A1S1MTJ1_9GAMM|nr:MULTISPECIES: DUF3301 domain-containing protein [Pseudoalteromonas]MCF6436359.1 DUF3301 domain-containing protein [Pseudoalteromonas sp. MMG022]OHU86720.1 hypothetical protein BFC16_14580 [Pseudoalteromonas sp. JW3]OHU88756.1 hypothetical protein BET10_18180 [Pseudoalteromonas amylolytica]